MTTRLLAFAVLFLSLAAAAQAAPSRDSVAGPFEVLVEAGGVARQGEFADVGFAFTNNSSDVGVQVHVDEIAVHWADGTHFDLGVDERRFLLDPLGGRVLFLALVVPADAPVGTATFIVRAHVSRVPHAEDISADPSFPEYRLHGGTGHSAFPGDSHVADHATFNVVP